MIKENKENFLPFRHSYETKITKIQVNNILEKIADNIICTNCKAKVWFKISLSKFYHASFQLHNKIVI